MRVLKITLAVMIGLAGIAATITTFIAIGYALKIIAAFAAVFGVLGLIGLIFYGIFYEFVILPRRKRKEKGP